VAAVGGLPVGLMAIGRHFEDDRLLGLARSYEGSYGWAPEAPADQREARRRAGSGRSRNGDLQAPDKEKL
jgi:hypothetical protein